MSRTGTLVGIEGRVAEGGQGVVYRGTTQAGMQVAVKWIKPNPYLEHQRHNITELTLRPRPHPAFAWPIDVVSLHGLSGFGYVMQWIPERFTTLIEMVDATQQPSFRVLAGLGRELVDAFSKLHANALCYRDINFGNLLVDPERTEVAIVDNDNVGEQGTRALVWGSLRFMAPEVICHKADPSTESDLYSLAVFLFFMLVGGHPLEGIRVQQNYSWNSDGHASETEILLQQFGIDPLFVFDPVDTSNAPEPGHRMWTWWPIYPRFIQELFVRAFGKGLRDPSVGVRVTEGEWRRAMVRLADSVNTCKCTAAVIWDPENPRARCWSCDRVVPPPMVLQLRGHTLVLDPDAVLTSHHLSNDLDFRTLKGVVQRHPHNPGELVLKNLSDETWTVEPIGEGVKTVEPGKRLGVRPMSIRFGSVTGSIAQAPAGPPTQEPSDV